MTDKLGIDSSLGRRGFKSAGVGFGAKLGARDGPAHDSRLGVMKVAELGTELETELDDKKESVDGKLTLEEAFAVAGEDLGGGTNADR